MLLALLLAGCQLPGPAFAGEVDPAARLDGLSILYQLDAGVMGVTYGRRWLAGPKFTSAAQTGGIGTVIVKVRGMDTRKDPVSVSPEWTIPDPDMIEVTARRDSEFTITVRQAGESRLVVGAQGYSLELLVRTTDLGGAMQVEITELSAGRPGPSELSTPHGPGITKDQELQTGNTSRKTAPPASPAASSTST